MWDISLLLTAMSADLQVNVRPWVMTDVPRLHGRRSVLRQLALLETLIARHEPFPCHSDPQPLNQRCQQFSRRSRRRRLDQHLAKNR